MTHNTYLKAYCTSLPEALACLEKLKTEFGFVPDRVSYNSVLNLAVVGGDLAKAWDIVKRGKWKICCTVLSVVPIRTSRIFFI